jgi:hypothetical protein
MADSEFEVQEILCTQAILGDVDLAAASVWRLSEQERRVGVLFVCLIELYRGGRLEEAAQLHKDLPIQSFSAGALAQMAIGASNHVPWEIYPYPDY